MALQNGVLVHGPRAWGCAVRDEKAASFTSRPAASRAWLPWLASACRSSVGRSRSPRRSRSSRPCVAPSRRRASRSRSRSVLAAIFGTAVAARMLRRSRLSAGTREVAAAGVAFLPQPSRSAGGSRRLPRRRAHLDRHVRERRQPLRRSTALRLAAHRADGRLLARRERRRCEGAGGTRPRAPRGHGRRHRGSVEVFSWVAQTRRIRSPRLLARPGFEIQRHLSTAEPSPTGSRSRTRRATRASRSNARTADASSASARCR